MESLQARLTQSWMPVAVAPSHADLSPQTQATSKTGRPACRRRSLASLFFPASTLQVMIWIRERFRAFGLNAGWSTGIQHQLCRVKSQDVVKSVTKQTAMGLKFIHAACFNWLLRFGLGLLHLTCFGTASAKACPKD